MMKSVGEVLQRKNKSRVLEASDVRHFIERYLSAKVSSNQIICDRVRGGRVVIRVGSPTLQQEVYLLEYDLAQELAREANYKLKSLRVTQS